MTRDYAARLLLEATRTMFEEGRPLMTRLLPEGPLRQWNRYPDDGIASPTGARCFYHVHPADPGDAEEHGHFHFFLPRSVMDRRARPLCAPHVPNPEELVHIIALGIDRSGVPSRLFAVNRWVTDEYLYSADAVIAALPHFTLADALGDRTAIQWLTALIHLAAPDIHKLLIQRDALLKARDPAGEDRTIEVTGETRIDLEAMVAAALPAVT